MYQNVKKVLQIVPGEQEFSTLMSRLRNKESSVAVIGMGYVGLPVAIALGEHYATIGYDICESKITRLRRNEDPAMEVNDTEFVNKDIHFTVDESRLSGSGCFIVAVPTPIDSNQQPNLGPLRSATEAIARNMQKGSLVIFESTVYPGCTEEVCIPILEKLSGLRYQVDFKVGYSPERINPGDKAHGFRQIAKVVSGSDAEALEVVKALYGSILEAPVYPASSIKVAEASKIVENTQRDLNIAFMNELAMMFDRFGISTQEVLDAAASKWNFLPFFPGLVGGHCIGVDPYYLIRKAEDEGYSAGLIRQARQTNERFPAFLAQKLTTAMEVKGRSASSPRVLVRGITFKENVSDLRNSKAADLVKVLLKAGCEVDVEDPMVDTESCLKELGIPLSKARGCYDGIVIAVPHSIWVNGDIEDWEMFLDEDTILMDLRGVLNGLDLACKRIQI